MAETILAHSYLVLLGPLAAFVIIGLWLGRANPRAAGVLATAVSGLNLAAGIAVATSSYGAVFAPGAAGSGLIPVAFDWLNITPALTVRMGIALTPLTVVMMLVVLAIALPVNLYSLAYMRGERGYGRFFALLSLFVFSMLGLALSTNIFQMFVFWELVGVSSYTLVGFWHHKPSAVAASQKAFIVTRFADAFFLLGVILLGHAVGSFDFTVLNAPETARDLGRPPLPWLGGEGALLTIATLLVFIGGWGKSAMFPLHIWLPDAMEGPTPVSSIIHSATMVVAGVFLTARMFPLFAAAELTLDLVRLVGAFTALFAAVVAITQTDIKRVLAFSTLSQLGYMMFSLGAARLAEGGAVNPLAYSAAIFHIFTHAWFKCLLFLGAGVVVHAAHTNDLFRMGGLRKELPLTYWTMLAACLAISGVFPLAGFWSKDAILIAAWQSGHYATLGVGLLVGGLTALYMFRLFFLVFHGEGREPRQEHGHEEPLLTLPLMLLALPTVCAGWLAEHFFVSRVTPPDGLLPQLASLPHPAWLPATASCVAFGGIAVAWLLYGRTGRALAARPRARLAPLQALAVNKFYIDEAWLFVVRRILFDAVAAPVKWFDRQVVDGAMNLAGRLFHLGGAAVRLAQTGLLTLYLGLSILGLCLYALLSGLTL